MLTNQATARTANVEHLVGTNNLEGARPSAFVTSEMAEYREGKISSSELLAAAKAHYASK